MKKINLCFIYGLVITLGFSFLFSSCSSKKDHKEDEEVLTGIEIIQLPTKTVYNIGENIDLTGMIVRKNYSNGKSADVSVQPVEVTGFDSEKAQKTLILTVTIEGFRVTFNVEITDLVLESLILKKMPGRLIYTLGESLDLTGIEVVGRYSGGTDKPIAVTATDVSGFSSAEASDSQVLTITISGKTVTYNVEILPLKVENGVLTEVVGDVVEIVLPTSVKSIGKAVFANKNIIKVVLNEGLVSIGEQVFFGSKLQTITFPSTLKEVGKYAFYKCADLKQIDLSNTQVSVMEEGVFGFSGITEVKFPATVKEIIAQAFMNTSNLKQITLNEGLEVIELEAFRESGIQTVNIPNSVIVLAERAFYICADLKEAITYGSSSISNTIQMPPTMGASSFERCPALTRLEIPLKIENIGRTILNGNTGVTSITIPAHVKYIEFAAFKYSGIKNVIVKALIPPVADVLPGVWYGFPDDLKSIKVPVASLDAYKEAVGWKDYVSKIIVE